MNVECLRCGYCCPNTCKEKVKDPNTGLVTCLIHPTITGKSRQALGYCDFPPIYFFRAGVACKESLQALREIYPNLTYETITLDNGQVIIKKGSLNFGV